MQLTANVASVSVPLRGQPTGAPENVVSSMKGFPARSFSVRCVDDPALSSEA
jgi:hypothetical protein